MEEYKIGENTQCVGRYISMLYRASNCYINKELCKYGIGSGQYIFYCMYLIIMDAIKKK